MLPQIRFRPRLHRNPDSVVNTLKSICVNTVYTKPHTAMVESAHVIIRSICRSASAVAFRSVTVTMAESSSKDFQRMDDEAELLLHTTHLFKVKKEMECEDWRQLKQ